MIQSYATGKSHKHRTTQFALMSHGRPYTSLPFSPTLLPLVLYMLCYHTPHLAAPRSWRLCLDYLLACSTRPLILSLPKQARRQARQARQASQVGQVGRVGQCKNGAGWGGVGRPGGRRQVHQSAFCAICYTGSPAAPILLFTNLQRGLGGRKRDQGTPP